MRYDQLEHAIRAACTVADDEELIVFGSQAILGSYPDAPEALRASIEVDVQPKNKVDATDLVDGTLGEFSMFHRTHGFYVHGVSIEAAILPDGWEDRTIAITHPIGTKNNIGWCLEAHDLAASKVAAYREKDLQFVALLLRERMIEHKTLLERVEQLSVEEEKKNLLLRWTRAMDRA